LIETVGSVPDLLPILPVLNGTFASEARMTLNPPRTRKPDREDPRFPIGRFEPRPQLSEGERRDLIEELAGFPARLREALADLSPEELDTSYRPGGWTVRQVVHHLADSHLHSYLRFKLAVTEEEPRINAYSEAVWAELPDAREGDVSWSMALLSGLHERWTAFLRELPPEAFQRTILHPEQGRVRLERLLQLYAWHGRHHLAHIASVRTARP
jgi:uncharacterized damage-inducible protein DinB